MTENSICPVANGCGAFNNCTLKDSETCGGKVKDTPISKLIYGKILPEFEPGICKYCGKPKMVTKVNANYSACHNCYVLFIQPNRSIKQLLEGRT